MLKKNRARIFHYGGATTRDLDTDISASAITRYFGHVGEWQVRTRVPTTDPVSPSGCIQFCLLQQQSVFKPRSERSTFTYRPSVLHMDFALVRSDLRSKQKILSYDASGYARASVLAKALGPGSLRGPSRETVETVWQVHLRNDRHRCTVLQGLADRRNRSTQRLHFATRWQLGPRAHGGRSASI